MNLPYTFRRGLLAQHVALGSRALRTTMEAGDGSAPSGEERRVPPQRQADNDDAPAPEQPGR